MTLSRKVLKLAVVLTVVLSVAFVSCGNNGGGGGSRSSPSPTPTPTPTPPSTVTETFYAENTRNGNHYYFKADRLVQGTYCTVWAQQGSGVTQTDAKELAKVYDEQIYPDMIAAFNVNKNFIYNGKSYSNVMTFADDIGDQDKKLCILMLDILDNYDVGGNKTYIAGYFWSGDFFRRTEVSGSNQRDMIYIDTNPGFKNDKETVYKTLAHEMQHLMNFVTSVGLDRTNVMDTWIDEGLSSAAEWIYLKKHTEDRVQFVNDKTKEKGSIKDGNNFFVWGNDKGGAYDIMDEYHTVYLFFQWLRIQKGGSANAPASIYKDIISSQYYNYQAVTSTSYNPAITWSDLIRDWYAASYINYSTGRYGYMNADILKDVKFPFRAGGTSSIRLYPGEGVLSYVNSTRTVPASAANGISYVGLNRAGNKLVEKDGTVPLKEALLTFNADSNNAAAAKTVTITGDTPSSVTMSTVLGSEPSIFSDGPFPIGVHDVLRQNGIKGNSSGINFPLLVREAEGE